MRSSVAHLAWPWQRQTLVEALPSSTDCKDIKYLRAELKRVEQERYI